MRRLLSFAVVFFLFTASRITAAQNQPPDLYDNPPGPGCWVQASDGNLYEQGYTFNLTTLAAPTAFPLPSCNFIQGTDTNFYSWSGNTITKVTLAGVASTVHTLASTEGTGVADVVQGNDGNFYGVASGGGAYSYGTLFTLTPGGTFTALYSFTNGPDGEYPENLVQASDGRLYGTTSGTTFSATLAGQVTTIATQGGAASLIEGASGLLYGLYGFNYNSVSLSGDVELVANSYTLGLEFPIYSNCYLNGAGNFDCSTLTPDEEYNTNLGLLEIDPNGSGGVFYQFGYPDITNGGAGGSYSLSGSGSFFGVFSASGDSMGCGDECQPIVVSYLYDGVAVASPIQINLSPATSSPGAPISLTWQVNNAYSDTMQQCFASGAWTGLQATSGTATITAPSTPGNYRYALTCGGVETAAETLAVGLPTITLGASPTTLVTGNTVTLTAHVTGTTSGTPTGKVTFMDGTLALGSAMLNGSGVATLSVPAKGVAAGNYSVTATYNGSGVYAAATSASVALKVLATKYVSITELSISQTTVRNGDSIELIALVAGNGNPAPTGTVTFYSGQQSLGKVALTSDEVSLTLTVTGIPAGSYPITVAYSGDALWKSSASSPQTVTVVASYTPAVALSASPNPVIPPAQVTLTCTVAGVNGQPAPTGTVYFYLGSTYLGADSLNGSGVASFNASTTGDPAGTYGISATYLGDANYSKTSTTSTVTVQ